MKDDVARAYDRWAETYDTDVNATRDLDARVVRDMPLPLAGRDVLEIGCGTGKNTLWLASQARHVTALDFSAGMIARAAAAVAAAGSSDRVEFLHHDVRDAWPLPSASVDLVVGNLVLEHVAELEPVFREAARVLRAGGTAFFCELHPARQERGSQAQFTDGASNRRVLVTAYTHSLTDYEAALAASELDLIAVREWLEPAAPPGALPRLLSIEARRA